MTLQHYIADLLKRHNCVILPDFGGFVGNEVPAKVDQIKGEIYPPSKEIIFNRHLSNNDGLLADYVGKKESLDYPSAINFIEKEVERWISVLNEGNRIEIDELGFLFQNGSAIVFEQSREINLCLAAYGLKPVGFKQNSFIKTDELESTQKETEPRYTLNEVPDEQVTAVNTELSVNQEEKKTTPVKIIRQDEPIVQKTLKKEKHTPIISIEEGKVEAITAKDEKIVSINQPRKNRNWVKYAIAAAVIPLAFYSYWIPMKTDFLNTGKIQMADFNPLKQHSERAYEMRIVPPLSEENVNWEEWESLTSKLSESVKVYNYRFSDDLYIPIQLDKTAVALENQENEIAEVNAAQNFQLIVGCFGVKANAENLVKELISKGHSAMILDQNNGLHRVTAGGFSSKTNAEESLDQLRSDGYSGWILKK